MISAINNQTSINNSNLTFKGRLTDKIGAKIIEKTMPDLFIKSNPLSKGHTSCRTTTIYDGVRPFMPAPKNRKEFELRAKAEIENERTRVKLAESAGFDKKVIDGMREYIKFLEDTYTRFFGKK